jgi:hypothetical protein
MWRIKHRAPNGALALLIPVIYKHLVPPGPGAILSTPLRDIAKISTGLSVLIV